MKAWILLPIWLLAAQAVAQQASPPAGAHRIADRLSRRRPEPSAAGAERPGHRAAGDEPEALPNAADYRVTVTDLDRNGDGVVSRDEVPEGHALASEFKLVDRNHDGRVSAEELAAWR